MPWRHQNWSRSPATTSHGCGWRGENARDLIERWSTPSVLPSHHLSSAGNTRGLSRANETEASDAVRAGLIKACARSKDAVPQECSSGRIAPATWKNHHAPSGNRRSDRPPARSRPDLIEARHDGVPDPDRQRLLPRKTPAASLKVHHTIRPVFREEYQSPD